MPCGALLITAFFAFSPQSPPTLDQTTFPAKGAGETLVHVDRLGRYSFRVESDAGVALELLDMAVGSLARDGEAGARDGRIDVLLDEGTYKLKLAAHARGTGEATVTVHAFREASKAMPPLLDLTLTDTRLADLEQRSYVLHVSRNEVLNLELMGRNLIDAEIWFPGGWAMGFEPTRTEYAPIPGRPMTHLEFHHQIAAGTYILTCYGGAPHDWADDDGSRPLYIRRGIPSYGVHGTHRLEITPFGREVFRVEAGATYHEIAREEKAPTKLIVRNTGRPDTSRFSFYGRRAEIDKASREPFASLSISGNGEKTVVIEGRPGDEVRYRHFRPAREVGFSGPGKFRVGALASLRGRDTLELTGLLYQAGSGPIEPLRSTAVPLGSGQGIARRTNLEGTLSLFLNVTEEGTYRIFPLDGGTAEAECRIEPLLASRDANYRPPAFRALTSAWRLTKGFHVLSFQPRRAGILAFALAHADDEATPAIIPNDQLPQQLGWQRVQLDDQRRYVAMTNIRGVATSLFARKSPLELDEGIPLILEPGASVDLSPITRVSSIFRLEADPGVRVTRSGTPIQTGTRLDTGRHTLRFSNTGDRVAELYAWTSPAPTEPHPLALDNPTQQLDALDAQAPHFAEYDRNSRVSYLLEVDRPGLYRVETSGRLATRLAIRSRLVTAIATGEQNGIGRNGLVQQYLRPGTYLVTVDVLGQSTGRAGVHLRRTELREGGLLPLDRVAAATLGPDEALVYDIEITEKDTYLLENIGPGREYPTRLEDADGFPGLSAELEPGRYRLFTLPISVGSRRLVRVYRSEDPVALEGKGPHPIEINHTVTHRWRRGGPDRYSFTLTAPIEARLDLSRGMRLELRRDGEPVLETARAIEAPFMLASGTYEVRLQRIEQDDDFPYRFTISTEWMAPGLSRMLTEPGTVTVSLGNTALVDLSAHGRADVAFTLGGEDITLQADDRENNWNPLISRRLPAGTYTLDVAFDPSFSGWTELSLNARPESEPRSVRLPFEETMGLGDAVEVFSFDLDETALLDLAVTGGATLALARKGTVLAQSRDALTIPVPAGRYDLRVWQTTGPAEATVRGLVVKTRARAVKRNRELSAGNHHLTATTALTLTGGPAQFSPRLDVPLRPVADGLINVRGDGWLVTAGLTRLAPMDTGDRTWTLRERALNLAAEVDGPTLLTVEAVGTAPAIATDGFSWPRTARSESRAWTILPDKGSHPVTIWQTDERPEPSRFTLRSQTFTISPVLGPGAGSVPPRTARTVRMARGARHALTLDRGLAAAIVNGKRVVTVIDATEEARALVIEAEGDLLLANPTGAPLLYRVEETDRVLTHRMLTGGPDQRHILTEPGHAFLALTEEAGTLHVSGAGAVLLGEDGVATPVGPAGTAARAGLLAIEHPAGPVAIELRRAAEPDLASRPAWTGSGTGRFRLEIDEDQWLAIDAKGAAELRLIDGTGRILDSASGRDPRMGAFLRAGRYGLIHARLGDQPASLRIHETTPEPIGEDPLSDRLIADNEVHAYRFTVTEKARVGVGLEARAERLEARLYDLGSRELARGPLTVTELEPGDYILMVRGRGAPVRYKPIVLGHRGPGGEIPDDVLRQYLEETNR